MQVGGDKASHHGDDHFGDRAHPRCWLGVANVGLDRADEQRFVSTSAVHLIQRDQLLSVANLGKYFTALQFLVLLFFTSKEVSCLTSFFIFYLIIRPEALNAKYIYIIPQNKVHYFQ